MRFISIPLVLLLTACGASGGKYPSLNPRPGETPRIIAPFQPDAAAGFSDEERASLADELGREERLLASSRKDIATARTAMDRAVQRARGAAVGDNPWVEAQLALSRFDAARAPLADMDARIAPLSLQVDALPAGDPERTRVEALQGEVTALREASDRAASSAQKTLGM